MGDIIVTSTQMKLDYKSTRAMQRITETPANNIYSYLILIRLMTLPGIKEKLKRDFPVEYAEYKDKSKSYMSKYRYISFLSMSLWENETQLKKKLRIIKKECSKTHTIWHSVTVLTQAAIEMTDLKNIPITESVVRLLIDGRPFARLQENELRK